MSATGATLSVAFSLCAALLQGWAHLFVVMALHEAAHALAHTMLGGRVTELHLGGHRWQWGRLRLGLRPWRGRVHYDPGFRLSLPQRMLVTAAGPAANLLLAGLGLLLASHFPSPMLFCLATLSLVVGVLNLLPVLHFDGRRLLEHTLRLADVPVQRRVVVMRRAELASCLALSALATVLMAAWLLG